MMEDFIFPFLLLLYYIKIYYAILTIKKKSIDNKVFYIADQWIAIALFVGSSETIFFLDVEYKSI